MSYSYSSDSEVSSLPSTPLTHVIAPQFYNSPNSIGRMPEETEEDVFARPRGAPSYGTKSPHNAYIQEYHENTISITNYKN
jgi:hypothetical protein